MTDLTSDTRLLLDPWSSEYPASVQVSDETPTNAPATVDTAVEIAVWAAQAPGRPPEIAWFIDGVRRLEARVVGIRRDGIVHGVFASFGTGAVAVNGSRACFTGCEVTRKLVLTSGYSLAETIRAGGMDLPFEALTVSADEPAGLMLAVQNAMRQNEANLAASFTGGIVFLDGPLAFLNQPAGAVVGVVKTMQRMYLEPGQMDLVLGLRTGERTPIFAIREGQKDRYSWYLRVAEGRRIHHGLSGIMRLETSSSAGIDAAVELAQASAGYLPKFASSSARDARAPQNLTPVGALEEHLRGRLGDATLIQRAIELRISQGLVI